MAQHSHVPKFGSWEGDNVPYTIYFENARKEKTGVRMNPNDPEENPDLFNIYGRELREGSEIDGDNSQQVHNLSYMSSGRYMQSNEGHKRVSTHRRSPSDQQKVGSHRSVTSESGSERSSTEYSRRQQSRNRPGSEYRKGGTESSSSLSHSVPGGHGHHTRQKSGSQPPEDTHRRTASIPKFGAWDETDPRSGEGFTVIFNKVKQEKQIASTTFPTVPPQPSNYEDNQRKQGSSSSKSRICCCCLFN